MAATKSKPKTAAKKAKPAARKVKSAPSKSKKAAPSKPKAAGKAGAKARPTKATKTPQVKAPQDVLDFGEFPAGSVTGHEVTLCLSCIFKLFTNQMGLAPRTAYNEIRRYAPTVAELTAREPARPFFKPAGEKNPRCPYCDAPKRWHAA